MKNKLRVGLIGIGGMGYGHYLAYYDLKDAELVAVCDIRTDMAKEKILKSAQDKNLSTDDLPVVYADFKEMIEKENLDMVDICTPSYLHAEMAVYCLDKGLNVLCEKPMTLTKSDAEKVIEAEKRSGKKFMVAHVVRFMPAYVYLKETILSKKYENLLRLDMKRVSSIPTWSYNDWMRDEKLSGGVGLDLSVHDLDFVLSVLGTPDNLSAVYRPIIDNSTFIASTLKYNLDGNPVVTLEGTWFNTKMPFRADYLAVFDNGYLRFEGGKLDDNGTVTDIEPKQKKQDLGINISGNSVHAMEIGYFVNCVLNDLPVTYVSPESSKNSVATMETLINTAERI